MRPKNMTEQLLIRIDTELHEKIMTTLNLHAREECQLPSAQG